MPHPHLSFQLCFPTYSISSRPEQGAGESTEDLSGGNSLVATQCFWVKEFAFCTSLKPSVGSPPREELETNTGYLQTWDQTYPPPLGHDSGTELAALPFMSMN